LRVQRQQVLQPLQRVQHQHAAQAEGQQRRGVLQPRLLALLVHAAQAADRALDRSQHRWPATPLEHAVQVTAQRPGHGQDRKEERKILQPSVDRHGHTLRSARAAAARRPGTRPAARRRVHRSSGPASRLAPLHIR
jgi:hypothetical protein